MLELAKNLPIHTLSNCHLPGLAHQWQDFLVMVLVCYVLDEAHIAVNAFLPELVISPFASSCLHRSLLSSVQWLPFLLGESLCANRPSCSFFNVESIHPKHKASSTISMYGRVSALGVFDLLQATQQNFSERWFCSNHSLSCFLSVNVNRFVTSIGRLL